MPRTGAVSCHAITARDVPRKYGRRHAPIGLKIGKVALDGAQADPVPDPISHFVRQKRFVRTLLEESVQFLALFCPIWHNLRMIRRLYHTRRISINGIGSWSLPHF